MIFCITVFNFIIITFIEPGSPTKIKFILQGNLAKAAAIQTQNIFFLICSTFVAFWSFSFYIICRSWSHLIMSLTEIGGAHLIHFVEKLYNPLKTAAD